MSDFRCAAVILAAGASTRLGQSKQLLCVGEESLLRRTTRLAIDAGCSPVLAVLGFEAEQMRNELSGLSAAGIINPGWQEGMGSSLRFGVASIRALDTQPDAAMVLICDQPRLNALHLRKLLAQHEVAQAAGRIAITASVYEGRAGVPAIFSSQLFPGLETCSGDEGARRLIQANPEKVQGIPWPAGTVDIDRPEDLATIEQ